MTVLGTLPFREVTCVDFEYGALPGERPTPVCMVAHELKSGRTLRLWEDELRARRTPPYPIDKDSLIVAYYASAEVGCHLALGWDVPVNVLDLYTEFRNHTNGRTLPCGRGLLGALAYFGIDGIDTVEKDSMRALALRGGPWSAEERQALLDYCEGDVVALTKLLPRMVGQIDLERAGIRGRYMVAAARIEEVGIPIDMPMLTTLRQNWGPIKTELIRRVDQNYNVYDGSTFKADRFERWLIDHKIPWVQLPSGRLALDEDTFKTMTNIHAELQPLRELRASLSEMKLEQLAVGADGRNRCMLSAFSATTGRNQPSTTKFIFGPSVWLRSLIRPEPGWGIAYIDWEQQEFGIAAALSGDGNMIAAYESGDPYLAFAKQAGAVPTDATKLTHPSIREQFKSCVLAVQYGMGSASLAVRIGQSEARARELLRLHRRTYPRFWQWSDGVLNYATLHQTLNTTYGWTIHLGPTPNGRSLRNFPMQANGAEMLRLACISTTEQGIRVCAPVHDAILIEAPLPVLDDTVRAAQSAMEKASSLVLQGISLRSEAKVIRYPDRYMDPRGQYMYDTVQAILAEQKSPEPLEDAGADSSTMSYGSANGGLL